MSRIGVWASEKYTLITLVGLSRRFLGQALGYKKIPIRSPTFIKGIDSVK